MTYYIIVDRTIINYLQLMLILGHTGITLGASAITAGVFSRTKVNAWWGALSKYLDIRLLLVGALLPDIIDKPVGQYLFKSTFNNGRIFSHTLLFMVVITTAGWIVYKKQKNTWMLALAAGTLMHLVLDSMWRIPKTLFWPSMGWSFPKVNLEGYVSGIVHAMYSLPADYIPEIIGAGILLWLAAVTLKRKQTGALIKHGRIY
jgi:inner membrane protein